MNKALFAALVLVSASAQAQVSGTKHNLSSGSGNAVRSAATGGTDQVCVFCHVPHKARTDRNAAWNRSDPGSGASWGAAATTVNGTVLPNTVGRGSLACFSCHDGTTNIGAVLNSPTGAALSMTGTDADGSLTAGSKALVNPSSLAGNHPVSVRMPASDNAAGTYNGSSTGSGVQTADYDTLATARSAGIVFYADSTNTSVFGIECGSCHEPHDNSTAPFLRGSLSGSGLCTNCHNK
jgi:predicted CXXCH cytochrome family protein